MLFINDIIRSSVSNKSNISIHDLEDKLSKERTIDNVHFSKTGVDIRTLSVGDIIQYKDNHKGYYVGEIQELDLDGRWYITVKKHFYVDSSNTRKEIGRKELKESNIRSIDVISLYI